MRKRLFLFIPVLGMILGGCAGGINPVTGVTLDKTELTVMENKSETLVASIQPENATDHIVTWSTSNPDIAKVSTGGVVTGVSVGNADITVTTNDGGFTSTCAVTVTPYIPDVDHTTSIVLSKQLVVFNPPTTSSETIDFTLMPENGYEKEVVVSSTDEEVVTVSKVEDQDKITITAGAKAGKAAVKVALKDKVDGKEISASCAVEVIYPKAVTGVSFDKHEISLDVERGESTSLGVTISPYDASNKEYTVTPDHPEVAEYVNGEIVAHAVGTCTLTVTTTDGGFTDTCVVDVHNTRKRIVYIDQIIPTTETPLGSNAYIDAYTSSEGLGWPGVGLNTSNKIDKNNVVLSSQTKYEHDIYFWEISEFYTSAIFTNYVDGKVMNRWNGFNLTSHNFFQPTDWGVDESDESTVSNYNAYDVYKVTMVKHDESETIQYNIPQLSLSGFTAVANTTGYKWVFANGEDFIEGMAITADTTLYEAVCGPKHSVTYVANGASGEVPTQIDVEEGKQFEVKDASTLSYLDHKFVGWSDGVQTYQPGEKITMPVDSTGITLTAQWEEATKGRVYFTNNYSFGNVQCHYWGEYGNNVVDMTHAYVNNHSEEVFYADIPTGAKFQFKGIKDEQTRYTVDIEEFVQYRGYYISEDSAGNYPVGTWSVTPYTIEFNANGGEGSMAPVTAYNNSENPWQLPESTLTKAGESFIGWAITSEGPVVYEDQGSIPNDTVTEAGSTLTLYAKYAHIYTVTYDANGGTGSVPTETPKSSGSVITVKGFGDLRKDNMKFVGWSDGTNVYQPDDPYTIDSSDVTFTAQWESITKATVHLTRRDGWGTPKVHTWGPAGDFTSDMTYEYTNDQNQEVYYAEVITDNHNQFTDGTSYTVEFNDYSTNIAYWIDDAKEGNNHLLNKWTYTPVTVTFNANGGTGSMSDFHTVKGIKDGSKLPDNTFTYDGYDFKGWATTSEGEVVYTNGQVIPKEDLVAGTINLFAKWQVASHQYKLRVHDSEGYKDYVLDLKDEEAQEYETRASVNAQSGNRLEVLCDDIAVSGYSVKNAGNNNCWKNGEDILVSFNKNHKIYVDIDDKNIFCGGLDINSYYMTINNTPYILTFFNVEGGYIQYKYSDASFAHNDVIKFVATNDSQTKAEVLSVTYNDASKPTNGYQVYDGGFKCVVLEGVPHADIYLKVKYNDDNVYFGLHS